MLLGAALGIINGILFVKFKIPSFVVTLSTLMVLRGLTIFIAGGGSVSVPFSLYKYDSFSLKLILCIVVIMAATFCFNYTKLGKWSKAIGSGITAAHQSGVPIGK